MVSAQLNFVSIGDWGTVVQYKDTEQAAISAQVTYNFLNIARVVSS